MHGKSAAKQFWHFDSQVQTDPMGVDAKVCQSNHGFLFQNVTASANGC